MYLFIWKMCRNGAEMKKTHLVSPKEHELPLPLPSAYYIGQGLAIFFCTGRDSKCFQFCGPYHLYHNHSVLLLEQESSHR